MEVQGTHAGKPQIEWSTGLFNCCDDCSNCCVTCCCPCITFGQVAEIVDQGNTSCGLAGALYALLAVVTGCGCLYSCIYRTKMRKQFNLKGSECGDCLKHCFCEVCALTQAYRELTNRGFDVSLGWQGNRERQSGGVAVGAPVVASPVVEGGMTR